MGRQIMTEQFYLHSGIRETLELPEWRDMICWECEVILLSYSKARCYCCSLMWASSQPSLKHLGHPKPLLVTMGLFLFFLFWCKDSILRGSHLEENRSNSFLLLLVLHLEGRGSVSGREPGITRVTRGAGSQIRMKMALVFSCFPSYFRPVLNLWIKAVCVLGLCLVSDPASSFPCLPILHLSL